MNCLYRTASFAIVAFFIGCVAVCWWAGLLLICLGIAIALMTPDRRYR